MPEFLIEREMPGVGQLSASDLKHASQTSCSVLEELGPRTQWVQSWVTDDRRIGASVQSSVRLGPCAGRSPEPRG
jgi:hypothetical protein